MIWRKLMSRYENGGSLTRGEFVAHMERVDNTLEGIVERLDRIENTVNRPRIMLLTGLTTIGSKAVIIALSILLAYLVSALGFGFDPFIPLG